MNRNPEYQRNVNVRRTRDVTALSRLASLLFCGVVLACGFLLAAKNHFVAVQSGYQSENLRAERKRLIEENQRLALEKDTISAPQKLEPKARELGLQPASAGQIAPAENANAADPKQEIAEVKSAVKKTATR
jgi:cell division protein FtsL